MVRLDQHPAALPVAIGQLCFGLHQPEEKEILDYDLKSLHFFTFPNSLAVYGGRQVVNKIEQASTSFVRPA